MKVKVIRGSVQFSGVVYTEGTELEIGFEDLNGLAEVVEVVPAEEESEEDTESEDKKTVNYNSFKKDELIELAKERGIELPVGANKDTIVELLEEADVNE